MLKASTLDAEAAETVGEMNTQGTIWAPCDVGRFIRAAAGLRHPVKKILETGIRTEVIEGQVRFQEEGNI